jgi:hypothetical protein
MINVYITAPVVLMWGSLGHDVYTQVFQLVVTMLYRERRCRRERVRKNYEHIHYNNTTNTRAPRKHATNSHIPSPPTLSTPVSPPSPFHLKQSINPYQNTRPLYMVYRAVYSTPQ